jgi:hypothetical protein
LPLAISRISRLTVTVTDVTENNTCFLLVMEMVTPPRDYSESFALWKYFVEFGDNHGKFVFIRSSNQYKITLQFKTLVYVPSKAQINKSKVLK